MAIFQAVYNILWGDLITIPLPGGSSLGISLLVLILIPAGLYFTVRTRFLPFRLFPEMIKVTVENNKKIESEEREGISGVQALIVSTACRVGMGNLGGGHLRRRRRRGVLDVGDRPCGFLHRVYRGDAGPAL